MSIDRITWPSGWPDRTFSNNFPTFLHPASSRMSCTVFVRDLSILFFSFIHSFDRFSAFAENKKIKNYLLVRTCTKKKFYKKIQLRAVRRNLAVETSTSTSCNFMRIVYQDRVQGLRMWLIVSHRLANPFVVLVRRRAAPPAFRTQTEEEIATYARGKFLSVRNDAITE